VPQRKPIPFRPYKGFFSDKARLPSEVRERLESFLDLVTYDPDDRGFLATCESESSGGVSQRKYGFRLWDNYVVYWRVEREKIRWRDIITLKELKPLFIDILAIRQVRRK
jgi:hypothetical protein